MKAIVAQACSVLVQLMSMGSALAHNLPADIRLLSLVSSGEPDRSRHRSDAKNATPGDCRSIHAG